MPAQPNRFFDGVQTHPAMGANSWYGNVLIPTDNSEHVREYLRCRSLWRYKQPAPKWPWYRSQFLAVSSDQGIWINNVNLWGNARWRHGTTTRYRITGVTRDVYGTPSPNCTVLCLGQVNGDIVYKTISDANGAYTVYSPYYGAANIVVSYNTAPDIAGAVINVQGI